MAAIWVGSAVSRCTCRVGREAGLRVRETVRILHCSGQNLDKWKRSPTEVAWRTRRRGCLATRDTCSAPTETLADSHIGGPTPQAAGLGHARAAAGLTKTGLALLAGVPHETIARTEAGRSERTLHSPAADCAARRA
jgi:hypothetical protein